jgi:cytochrome c553
MINPTGGAPQFTPSVVQNSPQQDVAKQQTQQKSQRDSGSAEVAQAQSNQNFQAIAQEIIASRAAEPATTQPQPSRGQVVDILV